MKCSAFLQKLLQTRLGQIMVQFFKFGMVGVLNTVISLAVYYIFLSISNNLYLVGNIVGFLVSTLNAYWFNHKYVFVKKNTAPAGRAAFVKTYLVYGISLVVSTSLLYVLVNVLHISATLAPICCLLMTVPMNYLANKFWVYRPQEG